MWERGKLVLLTAQVLPHIFDIWVWSWPLGIYSYFSGFLSISSLSSSSSWGSKVTGLSPWWHV